MQINTNGISDLANTAFTSAIVESRIGTNLIDWQTDGSILLQNKVILSGSGVYSPDKLKYITDAYVQYNTAVAYAASGSFTVPAGVYTLGVILVGGAGGGAGSRTYQYNYSDINVRAYLVGGSGGWGGGGYKKLAVTPGSTVSFTVGAAGTGGGVFAAGAAGSSSSLTYGTYSATSTGGGGGVHPLASGSTTQYYYGANGATGTCNNADVVFPGGYALSYVTGSYASQTDFVTTNYSYINSQSVERGGNTSPILAYSTTGTYIMGARGSGGSSVAGTSGTGGVSGGVFFFYSV